MAPPRWPTVFSSFALVVVGCVATPCPYMRLVVVLCGAWSAVHHGAGQPERTLGLDRLLIGSVLGHAVVVLLPTLWVRDLLGAPATRLWCLSAHLTGFLYYYGGTGPWGHVAFHVAAALAVCSALLAHPDDAAWVHPG